MSYYLIIPSVIYVVSIILLLLKEVKSNPPSKLTARETVLGTKKLSFAVIAITLVGTNLGPADTIGIPEEGFTAGFLFLIFPALAGIQHIISGHYFAEKIASYSASSLTMGDIFGKSFNKYTRVIVGLIIVLQTLAFTGILALAGGQLLTSIFGWDLISGVLITAIFVAGYTYIGGMNSIINTDKLQFTLVIGILVLAFISATIILLLNSPIEIESEWFWRAEGRDYSIKSMITLAAAYFLGEAFLPIYSIRAFIADKPGAARKAFMAFGGFIIIYYVIMILSGISMNALDPSGSISEMAIVNVISNIGSDIVWLKYLLGGITLAALLGLTHSTLDSILNAGATSLVQDVIDPFIDMEDEKRRNRMKNAVIFLALFGTIFSLTSQNLIDILIIGYTIWVPTVVFPFGYILIKDGQVNSKWSAIVGIFFGISSYFIFDSLQIDIYIPSIIVGFVCNAIGFSLSEKYMASILSFFKN